MKINQFDMIKKILLLIFFIICKNTFASEAYFDLSEKEIQIETDFIGKEIIIFGTFEKNEETILTIQGPKKDVKMMKKERILGFWFNTKKVIYKNIPSVFFLSSSKPVREILNQDTIIKEKLYFVHLKENYIRKLGLHNLLDMLVKMQHIITVKHHYNLQLLV